MDTLSFKDCTIPVGRICAISSLSAAVWNFAKLNKKGFVTLERVTKPKEQIVWVCRHQGRLLATLPVFTDETELKDAALATLVPLREHELFCHGEYFFRTYLNFNNEMCIRAVLIFPDELSVRQACRMKGFNPVRAELVRFLSGEPRQYAATGWLVECTDAPPMFICFDLSERLRFDLVDRNQMVYETIKFKERFCVNGAWYTLERDDRGLLYASQKRYHHYRSRVPANQNNAKD